MPVCRCRRKFRRTESQRPLSWPWWHPCRARYRNACARSASRRRARAQCPLRECRGGQEGLAPIIVENLFAALLAIRDNAGVTMILAEQKVDLALAFAEDALVLVCVIGADPAQLHHRGGSDTRRDR